MNNVETQNAFAIMQEMAKLVATPGVSQANIDIANGYIKNILEGVIKTGVLSLSMKSSGVIF